MSQIEHTIESTIRKAITSDCLHDFCYSVISSNNSWIENVKWSHCIRNTLATKLSDMKLTSNIAVYALFYRQF